MTPDQAEAQVREMLKGIDSDESAHSEGWWETSTGAAFGAEKLAGVIALVRQLADRS